MHKPESSYRSYLIRCWWADNAGQSVWRIAVQEPGNETQLHFENLAALCAWLATQLDGDEGHERKDKESLPSSCPHIRCRRNDDETEAILSLPTLR